MSRVLLVDDDDDNLYLLRTLLEGNGYDVVAATNGAEALDLARAAPPDLVVADVLMPVMDGFTLCRHWMADDTLRNIPFVFYTASCTDSADERYAFDLGAARFLVKPAEPEEIVAVLRAVLNDAASGRLAPTCAGKPDEEVRLQQYNEALIRKLESKTIELNQANRALAESNDLRLSVLGSISDAFLAVDRQWRLTFFNQRAERLLRRALPGQALVGTTLQEAFPDLVAAIPELAQGTVPSDLPRAPLETFFAPSNAWFAIHAYPYGAGLSVFFHDITERRKEAEALRRLQVELEERVAQRTAELQAANKELAAFSYSVSHDLRAPLRVINGFSKMLLEDYSATLVPEGADLVRRIHTNTTHMGELIDALLSLSRVTRGDLCVQSVDLSAIAREILVKFQNRHVERVVDVVVASGVVVDGDANLLRVVLDNLLGNAWKFTAKHPRARIEFGVTRCDGEPVCFVRDDGAGFDPGYADKLFTAFRRLHSSDEFEGTGIGLATVRRVIDRHGGRVWSESAIEKGATFYFTLAPPSAGDSSVATQEPGSDGA